MDLTPGQKRLLPYWGIIQSAVTQRASTADLWEAVRADARREGAILSGVSATDMGSLRSIVARQRNATESFGRLLPQQAVTSDHIAQDISSRSLDAQALAPAWRVRFEHDITVDGQLQTVWRSSLFEGSLPATAGSLRSAIEADAEQMAASGSGGLTAESVTHIGVGRIQITAI